MRVYVAGSSLQLDRVKGATAALEALGHIITHRWVDEVEAVGSANPPEATEQDRARWAVADLQGVYAADVVWLLMPAEHGWGAGVELGYALAHGIPVVISGASHPRSIFTSLGTCYDRDDQALAAEFTGEQGDCECSSCVPPTTNRTEVN